MYKINVLIADDYSIFRIGLKDILSTLPNKNNIDEASNGTELMKRFENSPYKYDILFLDISIPMMEGYECLKLIRSKYPKVKIIVLSISGNENHIPRMYELDVDGYLCKNTDGNELRKAVSEVMNGEKYFCKEAANILLKKMSIKKRNPKLSDHFLSDREKDVLKLICEQKSTPEIANALSISNKTVNRHRQNLLEKLNVKNSIGLVLYAVNQGIFTS